MQETTQERIEREDIALFISACIACTGQTEFYQTGDEQRLALSFLHEYMMGNYRRFYARCLAVDINHYNKGKIVVNLLASGRDTPQDFRVEEGRLIAAALVDLPANRAYKLLAELAEMRINNRRTRAIIRDFLAGVPDLNFHAVKYKGKMHRAARHAHLSLPGEADAFLFTGLGRKKKWETPLFDAFRRSHYEERAIYELPYTIAEGMAARRGVRRDRFLKKIEKNMTLNERARLQRTAARENVKAGNVDWSRLPMSRQALYLLHLNQAGEPETRDERRQLINAMRQTAQRITERAGFGPGRVAAVLDCSYSCSGSSDKARRPLAAAVVADILLSQAAQEYQAFWTAPFHGLESLVARGQTDLATPLLQALRTQPDVVVMVSDGYENAPTGAAAEIIRIYRERLDPKGKTRFIHFNPVFDQDDFMPKSLGENVVTVGLRDGVELPTMWHFADFISGAATFEDLNLFLKEKSRSFIKKQAPDCNEAVA